MLCLSELSSAAGRGGLQAIWARTRALMYVSRRLHAAFRCTPNNLKSIARSQADGDSIACCDVLPFQIRLAGEPLFVAIEEEADRSKRERRFRESEVSSYQRETGFLLR